MNFDCVFINGDSYSAKDTANWVYGDWVAKELGVPVINIASLGCNNDRIVRSSVETLSCLGYQNPLVIIGWSFIRRIEVWYSGNNPELLKFISDKHAEEHKTAKLITLDWLLKYNEATLEQKMLILQDSQIPKRLVDFYTSVFMFSNWLKSKNYTYFMFSAARNNELPVENFPAVKNMHLVDQVTKDKNIFNLHEFYIEDWARKNDPECDPITGHLSARGHKDFAKHLLTLMPL